MSYSVPIAVSTGSLYPLPTLESIGQLRELGLREVELTLQTNEFFLNLERKLAMPILPELLAQVRAGELRVRSVHAPAIGAQHANIYWARREYLRHSIETCQKLGASLLVVHPLHILRTHEDALSYLSHDGVSLQAALLPGLPEILEQAQATQVILALENIQEWLDEPFFNSPKNVAHFLREMSHPALKFTFDLVHAQVAGCLDEFATSLADEIVNVHAADLILPPKRVPVGRGVIDWQNLVPVLKALPNLRQITVELSRTQQNEVVESVNLLANF
jgi:sugar phosphate isomerase/epimerase